MAATTYAFVMGVLDSCSHRGSAEASKREVMTQKHPSIVAAKEEMVSPPCSVMEQITLCCGP